MLLAAEIYLWRKGLITVKCCKLHHNDAKRSFFAAPMEDSHMTDNRYDLIIIGTGAGGEEHSNRLAPSGKRILILRAWRLRSS